MAEHFLGRRLAPDRRDRAYPMRLMLDPLREAFFPRGIPEGIHHYRPSKVLDQGATGTCVAHGCTSRIESAPIMQKLPIKPYELYRRIVSVDEWSDNDAEAYAPDSGLQSGTSVRAGIKVLQTLGVVRSYLWAESVEDVRAWHLAGFGGCIFGLTWFAGMFDTDTEGFIIRGGRSYGGHCVVSTGWSDRVKHHGKVVPAVRLQNSWGMGWGQKGRCWLSAEDLGLLLNDDGEAAAVTEQRVTPLQ